MEGSLPDGWAEIGDALERRRLRAFIIIATTIAVNQCYEGFGWDLTPIDWGHWLGVMLIMGAIIGRWGV